MCPPRWSIDDHSDGLEVVRSISELYRIHGMRTQVLSVSTGVQQPSGPGTMEAEICTMPKVFEQMYDYPDDRVLRYLTKTMQVL